MNFRNIAFTAILCSVLVSIVYFHYSNLPVTVSKSSMIDDFTKIDNLLKHSDVVIKGTIKETKDSYTTPEGLTFTEYSVAVEEIVNGALSDSIITVRQVGGEKEEIDHDGKKHKVLELEENHPLFKSGETYIMFLNKNPDEDKYTVGTLGYGAYKVVNGIAKNNHPGLTRDEKELVSEIKQKAKNIKNK